MQYGAYGSNRFLLPGFPSKVTQSVFVLMMFSSGNEIWTGKP
jgi:hypothetical protein